MVWHHKTDRKAEAMVVPWWRCLFFINTFLKNPFRAQFPNIKKRKLLISLICNFLKITQCLQLCYNNWTGWAIFKTFRRDLLCIAGVSYSVFYCKKKSNLVLNLQCDFGGFKTLLKFNISTTTWTYYIKRSCIVYSNISNQSDRTLVLF